MRLISYHRRDHTGVGVMADDVRFVSLRRAAPELPGTLKAILEMGPAGLKAAAEAVKGRDPDLRLDQVSVDPVMPEPQAIWALALNFKAHIEETGLTTSKDYPQIFMRMPCSQVGHLEPLWCPDPKVAETFDYEGELAVVIGTPGRHIPVKRALQHVAGYSCYNEGSVREFQGHNRQFGLGKNFERSGSFGPWLMTPDEFGPPPNHTVITRLNGVDKQKSKLDDMLFSVEQVIHYLSTGYLLRAGDVIVMGTPGALHPPPGYQPTPYDSKRIPGRTRMKPGDICEVEITGLGTLRNPIIADPTPVE
ncbi:MAG TPA: fumarylacetoacetate hydrolase family protein [Stellaceae bacterium]|nr:fumarylacetoacetate hydrolase family protein [Stellaceae bacterium]